MRCIRKSIYKGHTLVNIVGVSLHSFSQSLAGGRWGRLVGLPALGVDPLVVDEVAELAVVIVQPGNDYFTNCSVNNSDVIYPPVKPISSNE